MLTVQEQRRASPTITVFSLQKSLLAEQVEVNAEWFYVDKAWRGQTECFCRYGETIYSLKADVQFKIDMDHVEGL